MDFLGIYGGLGERKNLAYILDTKLLSLSFHRVWKTANSPIIDHHNFQDRATYHNHKLLKVVLSGLVCLPLAGGSFGRQTTLTSSSS